MNPRLLLGRFTGLLLIWWAFSCHAAANSDVTLRVGVLQFGTVNWELDVIKARNLAQKRGLKFKVVPLASGDASTVALQGGAVDMVVSDWIWVTRQRAEGNNFTLVPYSNAVGNLTVKGDSAIRGVPDLKGKRIGISGGASDKGWLLLRAYAIKKHGIDLSTSARPVFAAPPLLNELALSGQVDAVLNVWHFDSRLEAKGMGPLIRLPEILAGLGIDKPIPLVGWVFREDFAAKNPDVMEKFFQASMEAKSLMATNDSEWERLKPLMRAEDNATFGALRNGYRSGIPQCLEADYLSNVGQVFKVLAESGGEKLVGKSRTLSDGTFWSGFKLPVCPKN
ncbi:transporter substrate-binding domain-containing protein [Rhodoferax sp. OV413]|uniref:ABC transporter substrate-binding protein n=1 Tax=Rhodoferax sp. OV413 TaxID=1855285 RepID=UPI0025D2BD0D|nr:transporter substrate-binding domain-containing protein [Rhodoferax sp. OV413]